MSSNRVLMFFTLKVNGNMETISTIKLSTLYIRQLNSHYANPILSMNILICTLSSNSIYDGIGTRYSVNEKYECKDC